MNTGIFDGASGTLVPGDFLEVEFSIEVDPNAAGPGGSLQNQVEATANDPFGTPISDLSDDGTDPNTTNPGLPGDTGGSDDPTPLVLPSLGLAKRTVGLPVQSTGSQTEFDVTYQIVLENTGNVTLTGLDMYDDVATEYGLALVGISAAPNITAHTLAVPANLPDAEQAGRWIRHLACSTTMAQLRRVRPSPWK